MIKFCINKDRIYFNWASTGLIPQKTKRTMVSLINYLSEKGNPDKEFIEGIVEDLRKNISKMIKTSERNIALTHNTSEGLLIALMNVINDEKEKIICMEDAFPSTYYVVNHNFSKNEKIFIKFDNKDPLTTLKKNLKENVKAVVLDLVNYSNGTYIDLKEIGNFLKEREIYLIVDGIQGIGCFPFEPSLYNVDFLSVAGTKWLLGIFGSGFLYINPEIFPKLKKVYTGWLGAEWENFSDLSKYPEPYNDARRFETGTKNIISYKGFNENIKIINNISLENISNKILYLKNYFIDNIKNFDFVIITPEDSISGIVSIKHKRIDSTKIFDFLNSNNISTSLRNNALRFSFHYFNEIHEIKRALTTIKKFLD